MAGDPAFRYVILGSGRQGTAAAYDLARFGDAARVVMADVRLDAARQAAARVNELAGPGRRRGDGRLRLGARLREGGRSPAPTWP